MVKHLTCVLLLTLIVLHCVVNVDSYDRLSFDCPMRELAMEFALSIHPNLTQTQLQDIADGLNGSPEKAPNCTIEATRQLYSRHKMNRQDPINNDPLLSSVKSQLSKVNHIIAHDNHEIDHIHKITLYIDDANGDDLNDGLSINTPFKTIHQALYKIEQIQIGGFVESTGNSDSDSDSSGRRSNYYFHLIFRQGKYRIIERIELNSKYHNNIIFSNYKNEKVIFTGAIEIDCNWKLYQKETDYQNLSIYSCYVDPILNNITEILGLRINGDRGIRARYPNANPETDGFGSSLEPIEYLPSTLPKHPKIDFNSKYPKRYSSNSIAFNNFRLGMFFFRIFQKFFRIFKNFPEFSRNLFAFFLLCTKKKELKEHVIISCLKHHIGVQLHQQVVWVLHIKLQVVWYIMIQFYHIHLIVIGQMVLYKYGVINIGHHGCLMLMQ